MTEDSCPTVSSSESDSSSTIKQRKRRKWDQPDDSLVAAGVAVPGIFPLANVGSLARIMFPTVSSVPGASFAIPFSASGANPLQAVQAPLQQNAAAIVQKLVQPKIQDELIAREIVINDADSAIRYKLTKRQTQEEIQKSTGAVVITRGKYRPPNVPPDGERPLYLHISAAAHMETTAERIKAVDLAAAMVEEMLKRASVNTGVKADFLLKTCVFLGFEADPSSNIASRIRGPNDQYVNHIMNETGATVLLKGRGSGNFENGETEETQQPLHLLLSSNDPKSLERAKLLAENLLDTICAEFGASRVSSCKVYGAVPPPPQLQAGVQSPASASKANGIVPSSVIASPGVTIVAPQIPVPQSIALSNPGLHQANVPSYPQGLTSATSYIGYGGIYPQVTPLQQVALALRQSTSPATATVAPTVTVANTGPPMEAPPSMKDKRSQKRKFQELPASGNGQANPNQVFSLTFYEVNRLTLDLYVGHLYVAQDFPHHMEKNLQGSEFPLPRELTSHVGGKDDLLVQDPGKFVKPSSMEMPPPPPRSISASSPPPRFSSMPPPPPRNTSPPSLPPKFNAMPPPPPRSVSPPSPLPKLNLASKPHGDNEAVDKTKSEAVPDTLIKLMDYGDDDDDDD